MVLAAAARTLAPFGESRLRNSVTAAIRHRPASASAAAQHVPHRARARHVLDAREREVRGVRAALRLEAERLQPSGQLVVERRQRAAWPARRRSRARAARRAAGNAPQPRSSRSNGRMANGVSTAAITAATRSSATSPMNQSVMCRLSREQPSDAVTRRPSFSRSASATAAPRAASTSARSSSRRR